METGYLIRKLTVEEMRILSSADEAAKMQSIMQLLSLLNCSAVEIFLLKPFQVFLSEELNGEDSAYFREFAEGESLNEIATEFFGEKMYGNVVILPEGTVK